jgi:hypothetical protein
MGPRASGTGGPYRLRITQSAEPILLSSFGAQIGRHRQRFGGGRYSMTNDPKHAGSITYQLSLPLTMVTP